MTTSARELAPQEIDLVVYHMHLIVRSKQLDIKLILGECPCFATITYKYHDNLYTNR
jgi:hypothetical protein